MSTFCKDCLHCRPDVRSPNPIRDAKCDALPRVDLVTGIETNWSCESSRMPLGDCGPEGKLFVSRHLSVREQILRSLEVTPLAGTVN